MDGVEQREAAALANSPTRRIREVQRIEQGMGRGVRDSDDHCAVLLVGSKLAMATRDPGLEEAVLPATRAQLDLSNQVAGQLKGQGLDAVRSALTAYLDRESPIRNLGGAPVGRQHRADSGAAESDGNDGVRDSDADEPDGGEEQGGVGESRHLSERSPWQDTSTPARLPRGGSSGTASTPSMPDGEEPSG